MLLRAVFRRFHSRPSVAVFLDLSTTKTIPLPPPTSLRLLRRALTHLGQITLTQTYSSHPLPPSPSLCPLCRRKFPSHSSLLLHFRLLHRPQHLLRLRQLHLSTGRRRLRLSGKLDKYRHAASLIRNPNGLVLREIEFMRGDVERVVEEGGYGVVVVVTAEEWVGEVVGMGRERGVRVVVVGGRKGWGELGLEWREVARGGKGRVKAERAVGRWRDREVLRRLEWSYDGEEEEGEGLGGVLDGELKLEGNWWDLEDDGGGGNGK